MLTWLETTSLAVEVRDSLLATALLSGMHLVGMTVAIGAVLVMGLRLTGRALGETPVESVTISAGRGLATGLAISLLTGLLLVLPRASSAAGNPYFQRKMLALIVAVVFQFALFRRLSKGAVLIRGAAGIVDVVLWGAVAVLGCMFILLE